MKFRYLTRADEWLFSKVPMMMLPLLVSFISVELSPLREFLKLAQWIAFIMFFYTFGYMINDYCDRTVDSIAGKRNAMAEMSGKKAAIITAMPVFLGFLIGLINHLNFKTFILISVIFFWGGAYSSKPFRFKERGIWGLIISSTAQRSIPFILLSEYINISLKLLVSWMLLGFCVGMRYIFIHQYIDLESDRKSGVNTYLSKKQINVKLVIQVFLIIEVLISIYLGTGFGNRILFIAFIAVYFLQSVFSYLTVEKIYKKSYWYSYTCVPMEDFYSVYFPLFALVTLVQKNVVWICPLVLFLAFVFKAMLEKIRLAAFYITCRRG